MTDKHPLVSVLISTYNNEQTISDAVESIINQTYRKIEILIMDDSSTDSTSKILNDYSKKYEHVRVFTNTKNIGLTKSLNILLGKAEGELIARHDADDVSLENRISIQVKEILDNYKLLISSQNNISTLNVTEQIQDADDKFPIYTSITERLKSHTDLFIGAVNKYHNEKVEPKNRKLLQKLNK